MKNIQLIFYLLFSVSLHAQNVGIGTTTPDSSAILELNANNRGLLPPRMSAIQRNAIAKPATGLMVYDTDNNSLFLFNGTRWVSVDQTNTTGQANGINTSYTFSSPQFLTGYVTPNSRTTGILTNQSVSVSNNLIVSNTGIGTGNPFFVGWNINRSGMEIPIGHTISGSAGSVFCFDADSLEENIYAVINQALYRLNINNVADVAKIADSLGTVKQLKVLANNQVILTSSLNNGSLLRILPNGTKQVIASNLLYPSYFDISNNNYYVSISNALTGSVIKVSQAGVVSTILSDILSPRSIVFEKNNNFILQTNVTIAGSNYIQYNLYDLTGHLIGPVNDANDNAILTGMDIYFPLAPLYVDLFNNLVFAQPTTTAQPGNPIGNVGVWILSMSKD